LAELYLITPRQFDLATFGPQLERVLGAVDVACVRLALDSRDEAVIAEAAARIKEICEDRDIPVVLEAHYRLVQSLGLDGVHLAGTQDIRAAREALPHGAIVGSYCGVSRHAGLLAGEIGADYVSFGPITPSALGSGEVADPDMFEWWAEVVEVPVVVEGQVSREGLAPIQSNADFIAVGDEIWGEADPVKALQDLLNSA